MVRDAPTPIRGPDATSATRQHNRTSIISQVDDRLLRKGHLLKARTLVPLLISTRTLLIPRRDFISLDYRYALAVEQAAAASVVGRSARRFSTKRACVSVCVSLVVLSTLLANMTEDTRVIGADDRLLLPWPWRVEPAPQ